MARYWSDLGHLRTTLYRLYDEDGRLLYVGISMNVTGRFAQHTKRAWWTQVAYWTLDEYPNRTEALAAERSAIFHEDPVFNVARPLTGGAA